jgi:hypothetical protein
MSRRPAAGGRSCSPGRPSSRSGCATTARRWPNAIADGRYVAYDRTNVHIGDQVNHGFGRRRTVVKANTKTVACDSGYSWTDKTPYSDIRQVRCDHNAPDDEVDTDPSRYDGGGVA